MEIAGSSTAVRQDDEEIADLWAAYRTGRDQAARERLVHRYYPLVHHVARFLASTLSRQAVLDDLEGYGAEGLLDAIDRYDPGRGVQFSTFAAWRIRGAIYDGLRAIDWAPRSVRRKAREIETARATLLAEHGRVPTEAEEATSLGITVGVLRTWKSQVALARLDSLEFDLTGDGDTIADFHADTVAEPLTVYLAHEARLTVHGAVQRLPERERMVVKMSFGEGMTLAEIGTVLGVTESRVCQIRTAALKRLRGYMQSAGMDDAAAA